MTPHHPAQDAPLQEWIDWFWQAFLPAWIDRAHDPKAIGFYDLLDKDGQPAQRNHRSFLAQARLLFTFSHLALQSNTPAFHTAARHAHDALPHFQKASGLYRRAITATGARTGDANDDLATSYDQCFPILGLATWGKLHPTDDVTPAMEALWANIGTLLRDPATGLMLEHDGGFDPAAPSSPNRAQNPHMHLYEAALQAYAMTRNPVWMDRAQSMRTIGLKYFFDPDSGTITEFLTPDLAPLPGRDGQRREVGHQCEWAWLLLREVALGGDPALQSIATRLMAFADRYGFAPDGILQGAALDAVSADATWHENRFLLWPQTEAIKANAVRAATQAHAEQAKALALLMFRNYFSGRAAYANQLDAQGRAIWPDALSRLHYHLVLALTEGKRAGLWY
jgi:mannose/cellobiose epimerase-like protein (N-acyl-D-glucosamine 2-epimerase family)